MSYLGLLPCIKAPGEHNKKNKIYKKFYKDQYMMFLGLVGMTRGRLSPDAILMSFGLAYWVDEAYFVEHSLDAASPTSSGCKYTTAFLQLLSCYKHRLTSSLSLAFVEPVQGPASRCTSHCEQ
eukprot:3813114-Rhodomonas_salina.1